MPENLLDHWANVVLAIGALGTTSFALVDATKAFWGGTSNLGYWHIEKVYRDLEPALKAALGDSWSKVLRGYWFDGTPKDRQISVVMSALRLGLNQKTYHRISEDAPVTAEALESVVDYLTGGTLPDETDGPIPAKRSQKEQQIALNALGRLDAYYRMRLDAAFDRADHDYRNISRVIAGAIALGLSCFWYIAQITPELGGKGPFVGQKFIIYFFIGLAAVPLAPIAKDLATALKSAAENMKTIASKV